MIKEKKCPECGDVVDLLREADEIWEENCIVPYRENSALSYVNVLHKIWRCKECYGIVFREEERRGWGYK